MLDQSELNTLKTNDKLEHFLLISSFNVKNTKTGKQYLDMTLRDRSIELNAKMWSNFETFVEQAFIGSVVKVLGVIDEYNEQPQIKIDRIRLATEKDSVSPIDFLPNLLVHSRKWRWN